MGDLPSFQDIDHFSYLVEENEFFSQYANVQLASHYDANYIQWKINPTLEEFCLLEEMYINEQQSLQQNHIKFHWPSNEGLFVDVLSYISQEGYEMGKIELFRLVPQSFKKRASNPNIELSQVSKENLEAFLLLNYEEDLVQGKAFADHKQDVYHYQFQQPHVSFLLASIDNQPVGSLILISSDDYFEVDNVLTAAAWRKKGIATEMLSFVAEKAQDAEKEIILIADAEDTPRELYLKMGFQLVASQIHLLKTL